MCIATEDACMRKRRTREIAENDAESWREARREKNERNICGGNDDDDDDTRLTSMRVNRKAKRLFFERINTRT